jgi:hypothetical protein
MSDGVQAYVGIICTICSGEYKIILIDEPEAFLHPPLRRKLGHQLAELAKQNSGNLIASTHSSDFVMGCIQSGESVNIVRLQYKNGTSSATQIDNNELRALVEHPLMKSSNVMSALSYDGVIVTESNNDRIFYYEIYDRLSKINPTYPSILFLNAQNKQTIPEIIGPLRKFGIPAAAITDIDVIKEGGSPWSKWLVSANIPTTEHQHYRQQRITVMKSFTDIKTKNMKTDGGIQILNTTDKQIAENLFNSMNTHGVFPVRNGELESWLKHLNIDGGGTDWTIGMLNSINNNNILPEKNDVWNFIDSIVHWIANQHRGGMR